MSKAVPRKLAIDGGPKVRTAPWPPRRLFGVEEKKAAMALFDKSIKSGEPFGYNGEQEESYGKEFAAFMGGGFADGVNSGTTAVYVALRSLELEPFTEVIVPPITDPGGVMPVPLMNCIPVPADSAPGTYNAGPEQIAARVTPRTSAILVAHIGGLPCDMDPILEIARARGIPVVEDCAQTHGARYKGRLVGSMGEVAAFSTMFGKHHATGGQGGVVFTRSEERYWKIRRVADRGKPFGIKPPASPPANAEGRTIAGAYGSNVVASLNFNMDELHACIGRVQLKKLPGIAAGRRKFAKAVATGCRRSLKSVRVLEELPGCEGVYWFLSLTLDASRLRVDKSQFVAALAAEGIPAGAGYFVSPVVAHWYLNRAVFGHSAYPWASPLYKGDPNAVYEVPNAAAADAALFRISMHENWGKPEAADVLAALKKVEAAYLK